jgi:hypothetical protein
VYCSVRVVSKDDEDDDADDENDEDDDNDDDEDDDSDVCARIPYTNVLYMYDD